MARLLRLQFDMLGGNVRFHDGDPGDPLAGKPLTIDVDLDWDLLAAKPMTMPDILVKCLKEQLEDLLRTHRKKLKVSESRDIEHLAPWTLTAAAMIWCLGDQILVSFRNLLDYLPRPLPDIVTISWTVRDAIHWTIMDHICQPGNKPCKLGWQNGRQYLWYVPSGEHGRWCVIGHYEGQWHWTDWPLEDWPQFGWRANFGMLQYNKIGQDDLDLEVFFENFDPELKAVTVAQSPIHNYLAMPDICKSDQWLAFHAASIDGRVLQHMNAGFQADADIVAAAVRQCPGAIQWASQALQPCNPDLYQ